MNRLFLIAIAAWLIIEVVCLMAVAYLYRRERVYYAPRDRTRLTRRCRRFLNTLVLERGKGKLLELDTALGWAPQTNYHDETGLRVSNSVGARSARDYQTAPPQSVWLRIASFGDCMSYGDGVPVGGTWQSQIENICSGVEVANFGVLAYGIDQCYLRYLDTQNKFMGQSVVVLAVVASNVYKSVNSFRPFYSYDRGLMLSKPRFLLEDNAATLIPNPLQTVADYSRLLTNPESEIPQLGQTDDYYRDRYRSRRMDWLPSYRLATILSHETLKRRRVQRRNGQLREDSVAFSTTVAVLDLFARDIERAGSRPIVMLSPTRADVARYLRRGTRALDPLAERLKASGIMCVDLLDLFDGRSAGEVKAMFVGRHYSLRTHGEIALLMISAIQESGFDISSRVEIEDHKQPHVRA